MMSKALNTHLSCTDGGPFQLMKVSVVDSIRKPGLNELLSYYKY